VDEETGFSEQWCSARNCFLFTFEAMAFKKINPVSKTNPDTGFGVQASQIGGRFVNKDGSYNLRKEGLSFFKRVSVYSQLLELSWWQFLGVIVAFYLLVNVLFTSLYVLIGHDQIQGLVAPTYWGRVRELYFFSTQTFTTVGYGRINPLMDGAHFIAAIESMVGLLSFALVTGLLYGRFTRPQAYIDFSEHALISPYKDGRALMFRMVPYKSNHHLTDTKVVVNFAITALENDKQEFKFFQLALERSRIEAFSMNWTVVHPIDAESPLLGLTEEDMKNSDVELYVQLTGFNPIFSNTVTQRTSYTADEIIWGAKFKPMYHESEDGSTTIVELDKLNDYERV
jgi:inward rectifier potassium channel